MRSVVFLLLVVSLTFYYSEKSGTKLKGGGYIQDIQALLPMIIPIIALIGGAGAYFLFFRGETNFT